jgi:hypothetical protein
MSLLHQSLPIFWQLLKVPFLHSEMIWGIVPLYFGWALNELTSSKASFRTAIQTGFSFLWAAAHWMWQFSQGHQRGGIHIAVNIVVASLGLAALVTGIRRRFPKYLVFLGHTRFSNYFMIAIFPMQSGFLDWSRERLLVIFLFGVPVWILVAGLSYLIREKRGA